VLDVERRRQRSRSARHGADEILRLQRARPAEREIMIGAAIEARLAGAPPIGGEARIDVVGALAGFDISERDAIAG